MLCGIPFTPRHVQQAGKEQTPGLGLQTWEVRSQSREEEQPNGNAPKHLGLRFKFQSDSSACTTLQSWHLPNAYVLLNLKLGKDFNSQYH